MNGTEAIRNITYGFILNSTIQLPLIQCDTKLLFDIVVVVAVFTYVFLMTVY